MSESRQCPFCDNGKWKWRQCPSHYIGYPNLYRHQCGNCGEYWGFTKTKQELLSLGIEIGTYNEEVRDRSITMKPTKLEEFKKVCEPVIAWLNDNYHPHVTVIITPESAELTEGMAAFPCTKYIRD